MAYKVAFIIEKIGTPGKLSSNLLVMESLQRGHRVYSLRMSSISLNAEGSIIGKCHEVSGRTVDEMTESEESQQLDLADFDFILIRTNPPFDMGYFTAMKLLGQLPPHVIVTNSPASIINYPEKLSPFLFPEFIAPTLLSADATEIEKFIRKHQDIVIKPIYGYGGKGITRMRYEDFSANAVSSEPMLYQKFVPDALKFNKRIMFVDGRVAGAHITLPNEGEFIADLADSRDEKSELTDREWQISEKVGPFLKQNDILICGMDVIGGYISELNITSPGGIYYINQFDDKKLEADIWNALEAKRA